MNSSPRYRLRTTFGAELLRELVDYDSSTGTFCWKVPGRKQHGFHKGPASTNGYCHLFIKGGYYLSHRLAWLHHYGEWPNGELDHVNGDRADNRIANLRIADAAQNMWNRSVHKNNRTGVKGVRYIWKGRPNRGSRIWFAQIFVRGKFINIGRFPTLEGARIAYERAAKLHFGEFMRAA